MRALAARCNVAQISSHHLDGSVYQKFKRKRRKNKTKKRRTRRKRVRPIRGWIAEDPIRTSQIRKEIKKEKAKVTSALGHRVSRCSCWCSCFVTRRLGQLFRPPVRTTGVCGLSVLLITPPVLDGNDRSLVLMLLKLLHSIIMGCQECR